jgi:hypothetical protein
MDVKREDRLNKKAKTLKFNKRKSMASFGFSLNDKNGKTAGHGVRLAYQFDGLPIDTRAETSEKAISEVSPELKTVGGNANTLNLDVDVTVAEGAVINPDEKF